MSSEGTQNHELRLAHVLFVDIVGYSKLPINRQGELLQQLNQIVRATEQFRRAEAANKLCRSRNSHSQTAPADTLFTIDYFGAASAATGLGPDPQRYSFSGIG